MRKFLAFILLILIIILRPVMADNTIPLVSYSEGDGKSINSAIIINATNYKNINLTELELAWLDKHFLEYSIKSQGLEHYSDSAYDHLIVKTLSGNNRDVYFNITNFFAR